MMDLDQLDLPDPTTDLVAAARAVAEHAHAGQTDKVGKPYITHPARVAARLNGDTKQAAGWLHDVVEDTDITLSDLAALGFPAKVVRLVDALSHRPGEDEDTYLARIAAEPGADDIKWADMADNSDADRRAELAKTDEAAAERLTVKYARRSAKLERLIAAR